MSTINPYKTAISLLYHRIKWDFKPLSWQARSRLKARKNTATSRKAVILCNGPSLNETNFADLENVFCFGLNKINLLFEESSFRPSTLVAVNPYVIKQNRDFYNATDIPLYLDSKSSQYIASRESVHFIHSAGIKSFATDISMSVNQGYTVTYVAMQVAYHLGFREIGLVGCDHNFTSKGPANKLVQAGATDKDHFHPQYFSNGDQWQLPDLIESEIAYLMAKKVFETAGGRIVNCTKGGRLEIFKRCDLRDFLNS